VGTLPLPERFGRLIIALGMAYGIECFSLMMGA